MSAEKLDLGQDPIPKIFIRYAVPAVVGMIAMVAAYIIDGIFIGRYVGHHGLAAINLTYPIISFYSGIAIMVGTGGITLANIRRGEENRYEADNVFTLTNLSLLIFGIVSIPLGLFSLEPLLQLISAEAETKKQIVDYLFILFPFFPAFMLTFSLDLFVRSDGRPAFAVICVSIGSLLNVLLDYLLVAVFQYGISGAALATGLAQLLPTVIFLVYIFTLSQWKFVRPSLRAKELLSMLYNGLSEMINEFSIGAAVMVFNFFIIQRLGSLGVAAFSIAQYTSMIALAVFLGISQAIHPGISYNLGAHKMKRVFQLRNLGISTSLVFGILVMAVLLFLREQIAGFFAKDNADLIRLSGEIIFYYNFAFLFMGSNICISLYFTAVNHPNQSAIISLSRSFIGIAIALLLLPPFLEEIGIWLAPLFAEAVTLILALFLMRRLKIQANPE